MPLPPAASANCFVSPAPPAVEQNQSVARTTGSVPPFGSALSRIFSDRMDRETVGPVGYFEESALLPRDCRIVSRGSGKAVSRAAWGAKRFCGTLGGMTANKVTFASLETCVVVNMCCRGHVL